MRNIVIEIGFDWNAGSLGRLIGDPSLNLFPLQHGWVRFDAEGKAWPIWPTQIEVGDQLSFVVFDITRAPLPTERGACQPQRFEADFRNPNAPDKPRNIFVSPIEVPIIADSTSLSDLGEQPSHVFGHFEINTASKGKFAAWGVGANSPKRYPVKAKPGGIHLDRAFMTLQLDVKALQGDGTEEIRTYALDPEVYVGPFG